MDQRTVPLKYFMIIIKASCSGGRLQLLMSEVWPLIIFALFTMSLAVLRFRKRLD